MIISRSPRAGPLDRSHARVWYRENRRRKCENAAPNARAFIIVVVAAVVVTCRRSPREKLFTRLCGGDGSVHYGYMSLLCFTKVSPI